MGDILELVVTVVAVVVSAMLWYIYFAMRD